MKVIRLDDIIGSERDVACPRGEFRSRRYLLARDGMGFSMHRTEIPAGTQSQLWEYKNHLEACYCVSGGGILIEWDSVTEFVIEPGTVYAADNHDPHTFQATEDTVLICVFNPPVTGQETHQEDGSYDLGGRLDVV